MTDDAGVETIRISNDDLDGGQETRSGDEERTIIQTPTEFHPLGEEDPLVEPVFLSAPVSEEIIEFMEGNIQIERGGGLLGRRCTDPSTGQDFTVVEGFSIGMNTPADSASINFTLETWAGINREADEKGLSIVGWVHSHPLWTPYPSGPDTFIMKHFFNAPGQLTLIITPVVEGVEYGLYQWQNESIYQHRGMNLSESPRTPTQYTNKTELRSLNNAEMRGPGLEAISIDLEPVEPEPDHGWFRRNAMKMFDQLTHGLGDDQAVRDLLVITPDDLVDEVLDVVIDSGNDRDVLAQVTILMEEGSADEYTIRDLGIPPGVTSINPNQPIPNIVINDEDL